MKLAVVKPDHMGDLVLSSAAIRALLETFRDAHLLVAPKNLALARYLFPDADLRELALPHLSKDGKAASAHFAWRDYDQVAMLRSDNVVTPQWLASRTDFFVMPADTNDLHQSVIDYSVVRGLRGPYDIDQLHLGARRKEIERKARTRPRRIGFSIGSGFHANAWPVAKWVDLARELLEGCEDLTILCGPAELPIARSITTIVGAPAKLRIEVGSADFGAFIGTVAELDLVIATDGGTAHLCALGAPVLSVYGPSPFRRYAPFGLHNRLVTRGLSCSPCCQYAAHLVNSCLSTECMTAIPPRVVAALALRPSRQAKAGVQHAPPDLKVFHGPSHLDREELIDAFECSSN